MKGILRVIGVAIAACSLLLIITVTFAVMKKVVWGGKGGTRAGHIAVVDLKGMITSSTAFVDKMKASVEDKAVKGILVRINSPGGMVGPSQEMLQSIVRADKVKPVYVTMGAVAASGGYYAAVGGRKVYANAGTLTASVGVIAEFVNTQKLFNWAKIDRFTLKAGKLKDVGSPLRPMTPEERDFLLGMLKDIHTEFQNTVKERRKLTDEAVATYLDGRVMTGSQAAAVKMVDVVGGYEEAASALKKEAGLADDAEEVEFEEPQGVLKKLLWGEVEETRFKGLTTLADQLVPANGWNILMIAPIVSTP